MCCTDGCCPGFVRRYPNRAERRARLERYAEALENELQGVRERIEALTAGGGAS